LTWSPRLLCFTHPLSMFGSTTDPFTSALTDRTKYISDPDCMFLARGLLCPTDHLCILCSLYSDFGFAMLRRSWVIYHPRAACSRHLQHPDPFPFCFSLTTRAVVRVLASTIGLWSQSLPNESLLWTVIPRVLQVFALRKGRQLSVLIHAFLLPFLPRLFFLLNVDHHHEYKTTADPLHDTGPYLKLVVRSSPPPPRLTF